MAGKRLPSLQTFPVASNHFPQCDLNEAKGAGAFGSFTVTHDITKYTKAKIFSEIGKVTPMFARFSTVAGERGAADAERDMSDAVCCISETWRH